MVLKPLDGLYNTDMGDSFFAAASHVGNILTKVNNLRLNTEDNSPYINSGVMLMNIEQLRKEQDYEQVLDYIDRHKAFLLLPDQDNQSGPSGVQHDRTPFAASGYCGKRGGYGVDCAEHCHYSFLWPKQALETRLHRNAGVYLSSYFRTENGKSVTGTKRCKDSVS